MDKTKDVLTPAEMGMAWRRFESVTRFDPFWKKADYRAVVLFWCPDLIIKRRDNRFLKLVTFELFTSGGRRVAHSTYHHEVWRLAAAVIYNHLVNVRRERGEC